MRKSIGGEGSLILSSCEGGGEINFCLTRVGMTYFGGLFHPFASHSLPLQVIISQSLTKESILMSVSTLKNSLVTPAG